MIHFHNYTTNRCSKIVFSTAAENVSYFFRKIPVLPFHIRQSCIIFNSLSLQMYDHISINCTFTIGITVCSIRNNNKFSYKSTHFLHVNLSWYLNPTVIRCSYMQVKFDHVTYFISSYLILSLYITYLILLYLILSLYVTYLILAYLILSFIKGFKWFQKQEVVITPLHKSLNKHK